MSIKRYFQANQQQLIRFATFSLVFLIFLATCWLRLHPDFGWHLASGQYYLAHWIPKTDIFTYTAANFPWVNHEWLGDILLAIGNSLGGYGLLCFIFAGFWTLAVWLVGRRVSPILVLLATIAIAPYAGVRAITYSVLALALLIVMVRSKDRRLKYLIPVLFLVWANVHGSFVIGFVYLGYQVIRTRSWRWLLLLAGCFAITLVNPYGLELYVEVFRTVFDTALKARVAEWASLTIPILAWPFIVVWVVSLLSVLPRNWKRLFGFDVAVFALGLSSTRNFALFPIAALETTNVRLRDLKGLADKSLSPVWRQTALVLFYIGLVVVGVLFVTDYAKKPLDREYYYPVNAVAYLQAYPCAGNTFNHYDYGGYLIWKLPGKKVFIDGRMPSWNYQGHDYMGEYLRIYTDKSWRREEFAKYDIRCAVLMKNDGSRLAQDLENEGWRVLADDHNSVLLKKA